MRVCTILLLGSLLILPTLVSAADYDDRIYGRITTTDGETFEGFIRWDKNEVSWVDLLDGSKEVWRTRGEPTRRTVKIFGITIVEYDDDGDRYGSSSRASGIRFGHLESLERIGTNRALLHLRSGQEIELSNGSTDIGNDIRGIVIEDEQRGTIELRWRDLELVEFMPAPRTTYQPRTGERLYGTLTTQRGLTFTGYICWDVDEVLTEDILDGEDEQGLDHEISFGQIARLARNSSRSTLVTLMNGEELVLSGTNDVNSSNRGILIMDPSLGQVRVGWDEFGELVFEEPAYDYSYRDFYTSNELWGTLSTRDGEKFTGTIRWDNDEAFTWELLNGNTDDVEMNIEFGMIERIERRSLNSARVTLFDGREFILDGSNDVNEDNNGIFITLSDGDEIRVDWDEFDMVVFEKP